MGADAALLTDPGRAGGPGSSARVRGSQPAAGGSRASAPDRPFVTPACRIRPAPEEALRRLDTTRPRRPHGSPPMPPVLRHSARLLAAALLAAGCAGPRAEAPAVSTSAAALVPADGARVMSEVRGGAARATLVNVWATWCAPCVKEMPELLQLERDYRDKGLRLVLVSADFDSAAPAKFLAERGVDYPTYFKVGKDEEFIEAIDPRWSGALPVTVIFDSQGNRRAFWEGSADYHRFEQAVIAALEPASTPPAGGTR